MGWVEERPQDATEQLLEYADTGRLIDLDPSARLNTADKSSTVLVTVFTSASVGIGACLLTLAIRSGSGLETLLGFGLTVIGLSLLLPAVRLVRLHTASAGVEISPGAVLPPELVRPGNWIFREGAWVRISDMGRDGAGNLNALLSDGDVVELLTPVTIAGGTFRGPKDPIAGLRR